MAFTEVQFIGYVLDTAPRINPDGSRTYLGLADAAMDIDARCALMLRAMQTARDALPPEPAGGPDGQTLKVFMAPEFFFRGATGAYEMDDVQRVVAALRSLGSQPQWADWVFVFGTIVGKSSSAPSFAPYGTDPQAAWEIYNFSLVLEGGALPSDDGAVRVVMKELMSGIDFIASNAGVGQLLLGQVEHLSSAQPGGPGREQQLLNYDGAGIFELAGITWGLEICLDHHGQVQRLQRSPQQPGEKLVQLQLVPSCGMTLQPLSVIAQPDGYVFNCDGGGVASHSDLAQWGPPLNSLPLASSTAVDNAPIALGAQPSTQQVDIAALYAAGAGAIHIYPACAIPGPQTKSGKTVDLFWYAADDYRFGFHVVYGPDGTFENILCSIHSKKINFYGNRYFLPLSLKTQDTAGLNVEIQMRLVAAQGPYAGGVWCKIRVPGFIFEGMVIQFSGRLDGIPPVTIW